MTAITHAISGELWQELRHGTALDDGTAADRTWGYGSSREVDIEVWEMVVHGAVSRRCGFGSRHTMTGSPAAWAAIRDYANDRSYMELNLAGDMDGSMGRRLAVQADRISAALLGASA